MGDLGDWLGKNADWLVGTVVGTIGIIVALLVYFWQRKPKRLDYAIDVNVPILSRHADTLGEGLTVQYEGHGLKEPRVLSVRIKNTGKTAVSLDEFVKLIEIEYENPVRTVNGVVTGESTPGVCTYVAEERAEYTGVFPVMRPDLMNPGDWFRAQYILDGDPGKVTVSCRFRDQSRPMHQLVEPEVNPRQILRILGDGSVAAGATAIIIAIPIVGVTLSLLSQLFLLFV